MLLCMLCCLLTVSTYTEKTIKMFGGAFLSRCMQHVSTVSTYAGSCKSSFSHIPVFGGKVFLIFPIIYHNRPEAHLHNWPI